MQNALVAYAAEEGAAHNPLIPAWYDIIWSAVCFVVILFLFWKVALPRMKKLLDERAAAIEGNIAKADEAQRKAEAALEEYTAQLAAARREAGEIRDAAREDGKKIVAEAKDSAAAEAARLTATAHSQIEAERQTALVSLRSEGGTLLRAVATRSSAQRRLTAVGRVATSAWQAAASPASLSSSCMASATP